MITFKAWAKNENKDISAKTLEEKQMRTVSAFPGGLNYPPQTGAPGAGDKDSLYPPEYYMPYSPTAGLSIEAKKKKGKKA